MKPDDIPPEIWSKAYSISEAAKAECVERGLFLGTGNALDVYDHHIARAILAERERCKKIAALFIHRRLYKPNFPACSYHARDVMEAMDSVTDADLSGCADDIAAIRKGGQP